MKRYRKILFGTALTIISVLILGMGCLFSHSLASAASTSTLKGKKVLIQGGSVARGAYATGEGKDHKQPYRGFGYYLKQKYSMDVDNVAIPGAAWYHEEAKYSIPDQITSGYKKIKYDYIIIHPSSNDVKNYKNFKKSEKALRKHLNMMTSNENWSQSKIIAVITPHPNYTYSHAKNLGGKDHYEDWIKIFIKVCGEYSIEVINMHNDDDLMTIGAGGSYDGKHPSKTVHEKVGDNLAQKMAELSKDKYEVTFDLNGLSANSIKTQKIASGKKAKEPKVKVNDPGQKFKHWSTKKNGEAFNFKKTKIKKDTTLYAVYEDSNNSGGGSGGGGTGGSTSSGGADNACADGVPPDVQRAAGCPGTGKQETLGNSINVILNSIISVVGFISVVYIVIGGVNYMTSTGDTNKLEKAKKTILYAVIGLVVCVLAFAIVNWVIGSLQG